MTCTLIAYAFFTICFDSVLRQPEYVSYVQEVHGGCQPKPTFRQDPPQAMKSDDYKAITGLGYDRGHLVPNADYGCSTYVMGNAVPQLSNFNRGVWRVIEEKIRKNYPGKIIKKGCKYVSRIVQGINIPEGCYWLVLDLNGTLIDNGYADQFTGEQSKELPAWYSSNSDPEPSASNGALLAGIFFFSCLGALVFYVLYNRQELQRKYARYKLEMHDEL